MAIQYFLTGVDQAIPEEVRAGMSSENKYFYLSVSYSPLPLY
jgi:hypothetical protein